MSDTTPCPTCGGSGLYGFVHGHHMPCTVCHGTGQALAEAPATKNPDWVDIEPFKSNTELAVAWQEWIDQGRSQEQIYGVANFFTGRGGRWLTEVLPNADAPQGAEIPPQPLNNLDELRDLLHVFAVTYRPETRESRAACIDEAYQAIQRLITAAETDLVERAITDIQYIANPPKQGWGGSKVGSVKDRAAERIKWYGERLTELKEAK